MHELLVVAIPGLAGPLAGVLAWLRWRGRRPSLADRGQGPEFDLPACGGGRVRLSAIHAPVVVLVFMSNRCPGVRAYDARLRALQATFGDRLQLVGVNSIDEGLYPRESLEAMAKAALDRGLDFPYAKDANQAVAQAYGALCTPQVFVLDAARRLRYTGRIDDSLVESGVTQQYVTLAVESILAGRPVRLPATLPLGCSIDASAASVLMRRPAVPAAMQA